MNKPAKPVGTATASPQEITSPQEIRSGAKSDASPTGGILSPKTIDDLADIAKRSDRLFQLYIEKLKTDDGYQVIEPKTVAATFTQLVKRVEVDPAPIVKEQIALWTDMATLWQRTASRILFNTPVEPVVDPPKQA